MRLTLYTFDDVCKTVCDKDFNTDCVPDLGCIEVFADTLNEQCCRCRATDNTPSEAHPSQLCIGQHADRCFTRTQ